ncbi:radical SAM protein [Dethiothermospora halolimnae]|uniref:radical SAM protein n=1 Tax=Dethiothermospora halolimnae TaxID=3114390 RepID=UPI003CCBB7D4
MFNLTIEINQICNLKCKYCYVVDKDGKEMDFDIALKTIDYGLTEARQFSDNTLQINFIGGEPLISFDLLSKILDHVELKKNSTKVMYTVSTNGIYINKYIMEFLKKYNFLIKTSLDGTKESNDINRVDYSNQGSYDKFINNIDLLRKYEKETGNIIQLTNVVTKNNFTNFYNNILHLTYDLGFKYIDTGFDGLVDLTQDEYDFFNDEIDKTFDYYKNCILSPKAFNFSLIEKKYFDFKAFKSFYSCRGGIVGAYIKTNGDIYACPKANEAGIDFGNVVTGIDLEKIISINNIEGINISKCKSCKFNDICRNQRCVFGNLAANGSINSPSEFGCWLAKKNYNIIIDNKEFFHKIFHNVKGEYQVN